MNNSLIKKMRHGIAMLAAMILFSVPAMASAQGWYAGIGVGQSKVDGVECDPETQAAILDISCSADDSDTAFKVFGGYILPLESQSQFTLAIELGYVDLGKVSLSGEDSFYGVSRLTLETSGFNLAAVGALHVTERVSLVGKLGFLRWDVDFTNIDEIESFSESDSGTDIMFGIGAAVSLTPELSARIEWERFEIDDEDADLMSLSLIYHF